MNETEISFILDNDYKSKDINAILQEAELSESHKEILKKILEYEFKSRRLRFKRNYEVKTERIYNLKPESRKEHIINQLIFKIENPNYKRKNERFNP